MQLMLNELKNWMEQKDFSNIKQIKGMLSQSRSVNPAGYLRIQFMKHFSQK